LVGRGRDAENAKADRDIAIAVSRNEANATRVVRGEDTVMMQVRSIMGSGCLGAIVEMGAGTSKIMVKEWGIQNGVIREEGLEKTIELVGGLGVRFELVEVAIKWSCRGRAALTREGWHDIKVSRRRVRDDMRIGENVKTLGAYGIDAESIIELIIIIEKIVDRTGRHGFEVVIFFGRRGRG
jgi:hypothetical protein